MKITPATADAAIQTDSVPPPLPPSEMEDSAAQTSPLTYAPVMAATATTQIEASRPMSRSSVTTKKPRIELPPTDYDKSWFSSMDATMSSIHDRTNRYAFTITAVGRLAWHWPCSGVKACVTPGGDNQEEEK